VLLFQEQAMQVAMVAAGFSPTEADQLRRAMATFKHTGGMNAFQEKLITGMRDNGYPSLRARVTKISGIAVKRHTKKIGAGAGCAAPTHNSTSAVTMQVTANKMASHPVTFASRRLPFLTLSCCCCICDIC
jgi:hypothetical protein